MRNLRARIKSLLRERLRPKTIGEKGEMLAARFLKKKGYVLVARSHQTRGGEIDLIAVDRRTVVFVEVKTRRSHEKGHPADAVDENKQRRISRLALGYLKRHNLLDNPARFDVVAITWPANSPTPEIEHFVGAFEAAGLGPMFG